VGERSNIRSGDDVLLYLVLRDSIDEVRISDIWHLAEAAV
jgi:hypothetical protein